MSESARHGAKKGTEPLFHFVSGLFSGVSSAVILQPADLLKTRVQQSRSASLRSTLKSILACPTPIASLWRGTVPSTLRTGFGSAVYFTTLNALRSNVAARKQSVARYSGVPLDITASSSVLPRLSSTDNLITGAIARVLAGFILMPMTVLKVRFESDLYAYKSLWSASKDIYGQNGVKGFFTGFGATAIRDAPYAGLYVVFYELSKSRLSNAMSGRDITGASAATINFTSGAVAAAVATTITNPFDAIKTRLQLLPARYGNMFRTVKIMLREDGIRSLFDGLALRMARKGASSALAWTVYEELIGRAEKRLASHGNGVKEKVGDPL